MSAGSAKENGMNEEGEREREEQDDLFRLVVVNSYGSQEIQRLKDDDSIPLKLGSEWMCVWWDGGEGRECGGMEGIHCMWGGGGMKGGGLGY